MKTIVIIGVGALGKRHLESILNTSYEMDIYCIDPYEKALEGFEKKKYEGKRIHFSTELTGIPKKVDFALLAMSSVGRREMFESLVEQCDVSNVIFEKVLFQKKEDYYIVKEILDEKNINAWVNCARREQMSWKKIKKEIDSVEQFEFHVRGGNWGLGCNSIHMLDLVAYLSNTKDLDELKLNLKDKIVDSKREGYKEINGTIYGHNGKCNVYTISCLEQYAPTYIEIVSPLFKYIISESKGVATKIYNDGVKEDDDFKMLYQSQLTEKYLESIFEKHDLNLATYDESMNIHLKLIEPLTEFFEGHGMEEKLCPIT